MAGRNPDDWALLAFSESTTKLARSIDADQTDTRLTYLAGDIGTLHRHFLGDRDGNPENENANGAGLA